MRNYFKSNGNFIEIALEFAKEGLSKGNLPVGAVLTIDGKFVDGAYNSNFINKDFNSHAEKLLIDKQSSRIYGAKRTGKSVQIDLFTTWEPCLMCLGTSVINRIDRIIYSCPDPRGGTSRLRPEIVGDVYNKIWPELD